MTGVGSAPLEPTYGSCMECDRDQETMYLTARLAIPRQMLSRAVDRPVHELSLRLGVFALSR